VSIFEKILRAGEGRLLRRLSSIAATVSSIEDNYTELTDAELQAVSGGLNPQPLPPRVAYSMLFSNVAPRVFQGMFAFG